MSEECAHCIIFMFCPARLQLHFNKNQSMLLVVVVVLSFVIKNRKENIYSSSGTHGFALEKSDCCFV